MIRHMKIKEYLQRHKLLADGAMGTYFDKIEKDNYLCSEEANIANPSMILEIHQRYLKNGARLLRSNTFLANRDTLARLQEKNAKLFANITLKELITAGYRMVEKAAGEWESDGDPVFPAADIGPILEENEHGEETVLEQYYELCDIFLEAGADIFIMETFPDEKYVLKMADYIKKKKPEAFLIGQFSLSPTGYSRTGFHYKTILNRAVSSGLLDAVGLNCGIGATHMARFITKYLEECPFPKDMFMTALPNCGYPQIIRGKAVYSDSVAFFGENMKTISDMGVQILGGCCGTTPEYIAEIRRRISEGPCRIRVETQEDICRKTAEEDEKISRKNDRREVGISRQMEEKDLDLEKKAEPNLFRKKLEAGELVCAVELDPPFDADDSKLMEGARALSLSKADIITISDSPLARSRVDSFLMAAKVKNRVGMDAMPHLSCRDKNRISIRSGILGGYLNGIRNYLFVTGDPVAREDREFTKSVFNFNSIRLMQFIQGMNQELFKEDPIFYGGALNQNGASLEHIAMRMEKKMEAGCSYFLTQPVYSKDGLERLAFLKEKTNAKILIGIMPLVSRRNALFIQNEMPGIYIPDEVAAKYQEGSTREEFEETAIEISREIIEEGRDIGAGYYFMTPFNRVSLIKEILRYCPLRSH